MMDMKEEGQKPRRLIIAAVAILCVLVAAIIFSRDVAETKVKPRVGVLTSMPIFWQEGDLADNLQAGAASSQVHERLSEKFELLPIDSWDSVEESRLKLLLLVQSRALTPTELEKFDGWVRSGGRALILADPALHWESSYPLGDPRRPLFTSMLSPLFTHWGLQLALPMSEDEHSHFVADGHDIVTSTPGIWEQVKLDGNCSIAQNNVQAVCDLGAGSVVLLADADLVDPQYWHGASSVLGDRDIAGNMNWIEERLLSLAS